MKNERVSSIRYRNKIRISSSFKELYDGVGCDVEMLTTYFEIIFKRKNNVNEKKRMNGCILEHDDVGKTTNLTGVYRAKISLVESYREEYEDAMLMHFYKGTIFNKNDSKMYYELKIPKHRVNVVGRLYAEQYMMYKEALNKMELEIMLRANVETSNGAYFSFSNKTLYDIITRDKEINQDGEYVNHSKSTVNKRIGRMIDKLLKANIVKKYGDFYSNAPNEEEYQKCIGETEQQWREEMTVELRGVKNVNIRITDVLSTIEDLILENGLEDLFNEALKGYNYKIGVGFSRLDGEK